VKAVGSIVGAVCAAAPSLFAALGGALLLGACASCQSTVRQTSMPLLVAAPITGVVSDESAHRLYLADGKNHGIDVIDISSTTPQYVRTIDVARTPHGLAVAPDIHRLYAGLSGGAVAVIDTDESSPKFMQVIGRISAGTTTADLLDYSAAKHQLLVSTGLDGQVVAVNTINNGIAAVYVVMAPVGQPRYNPADGMIYVTAPTADALMRIDPALGTVTGKFFAKGCHPSGLAINPSRQLAVAGCRGSIAMFNLRTGAQEVTRVVQGGDIVTYDAASNRFAVASPHELNDSAVGVFNGDGKFIGSVAAPPNARAAAFDSAHGLVYAPGPSGLMSLAPSACMPPPEWLKFAGGLSLFAVPLLAAAVFLFLYARHRTRRAPGGQAEPSFHDLQEQDLELERERMRAFEEEVLGPQVNPRMQAEP
jgi:DNA-binding beta-propeller fold protein YncE